MQEFWRRFSVKYETLKKLRKLPIWQTAHLNSYIIYNLKKFEKLMRARNTNSI